MSRPEAGTLPPVPDGYPHKTTYQWWVQPPRKYDRYDLFVTRYDWSLTETGDDEITAFNLTPEGWFRYAEFEVLEPLVSMSGQYASSASPDRLENKVRRAVHHVLQEAGVEAEEQV